MALQTEAPYRKMKIIIIIHYLKNVILCYVITHFAIVLNTTQHDKNCEVYFLNFYFLVLLIRFKMF